MKSELALSLSCFHLLSQFHLCFCFPFQSIMDALFVTQPGGGVSWRAGWLVGGERARRGRLEKKRERPRRRFASSRPDLDWRHGRDGVLPVILCPFLLLETNKNIMLFRFSFKIIPKKRKKSAASNAKDDKGMLRQRSPRCESYAISSLFLILFNFSLSNSPTFSNSSSLPSAPLTVPVSR